MAVDYTFDDFAKHLRMVVKYHGQRPSDPLPPVEDASGEGRAVTMACLERILSAIPDDLRAEPDRIGPRERERIAAAAGASPDEVDRFMDQFHTMRAMARMGLWQRLKLILGWGSPPAGPG